MCVSEGERERKRSHEMNSGRLPLFVENWQHLLLLRVDLMTFSPPPLSHSYSLFVSFYHTHTHTHTHTNSLFLSPTSSAVFLFLSLSHTQKHQKTLTYTQQNKISHLISFQDDLPHRNFFFTSSPFQPHLLPFFHTKYFHQNSGQMMVSQKFDKIGTFRTKVNSSYE